MRTYTQTLVVDSGLFNAHQLQPRDLLRHHMLGGFGWLAAYVASYPALVDQHGFGFVYMAINVDYQAPIAFTDFESLRHETQMCLMRRGTRINARTRFWGGDRLLVEVSTLLGLVKIEETIATSARPEALSATLQARFHDDEQIETSPTRKMPELLASIESSHPPLLTSKRPFCIARHQCEFADQWVFFQLPTIYEPARERLIVEHGQNTPPLKRGLRDPLQTVAMELNRPFYAFDQGYIETSAYLGDASLTYIHRLYSDMPSRPLHATIVERF